VGRSRHRRAHPSEIRQLVQHVRASVVPRRNSRGGRSAAEHLIATLRCLYKHAEEDGLINPAGNPARKVEKPRRLLSTRRAVAGTRLAEINHAAATTGDDRSWTRCCCACTPRPPAAAAARWRCARRTSTRSSA
jgi:integrase/recombinase XerC